MAFWGWKFPVFNPVIENCAACGRDVRKADRQKVLAGHVYHEDCVLYPLRRPRQPSDRRA